MMPFPIRPLRSLAHAERGATLVEFAFVAPVFCLLLIGAFDVGHTLYMKAILQGVVQKAARDSGLETGSISAQQASIDSRVRQSVLDLDKSATVTFTRRYFRNFTKAAAQQPEAFTDTNGDGVCDNGEPYQDANNNNVWDPDGGDSGQGGARDAVLYTADITYPRVLPLQKFIPSYPDKVNVQASTILENQPYGDQGTYAAPTVRNCP